MNVSAITNSRRREQDFEVFILGNEDIELAVVPELGARIISLKDLRTGREWLWHPIGGPKLFRNHPGDNFEISPLVGIDECLPTIAPCTWQGRTLPDHGELWAAVWSVDYGAWDRGVLRTSVGLRISPLDFERTIELQKNEVRLSYQLKNRGAIDESYLWAMHPLLRLQAGDLLDLPASTHLLLNGARWVDSLTSIPSKADCQKSFASPLSEGWAAINNPETGDRLEFMWDPAKLKTLGLWLNRSGWHGHCHFALEPANGEPDSLAVAVKGKGCGVVEAHGSAAWQVCIRIGN